MMAIFSPRVELKRVDFPTLGLPRTEIKPALKAAIAERLKLQIDLQLGACCLVLNLNISNVFPLV